MAEVAAKPTTLAKWKSAKRHKVTLPSSTEVSIELPNLPKLIKAGQIPNELIEVALQTHNQDTDVTAEQIKDQAEFFNFLVSITVVDPKVTPDEVEHLPYEDVEMLVEFATRQRDIDAVYHHIGGLEKVADFRRFRRLSGGDSLAYSS